MGYMYEPGFLGTKAPFFMDAVTVIVALLPFLTATAVYAARHKRYVLHRRLQTGIFLFALIVVGWFEYGVRVGGEYENFVAHTQVSTGYLKAVLIGHIAIAVVTLGLWIATLRNAYRDTKALMLPGLYSEAHRRGGLRTFVGIVLTALSGIWVYLLLFAEV